MGFYVFTLPMIQLVLGWLFLIIAVCFVLVAFLAAHDHTAVAVLEATVGVLVLGAALSALASPVRHPANG